MVFTKKAFIFVIQTHEIMKQLSYLIYIVWVLISWSIGVFSGVLSHFETTIIFIIFAGFLIIYNKIPEK